MENVDIRGMMYLFSVLKANNSQRSQRQASREVI